MVKHADITIKDHHFYISGDLHFANVMSIYQKSLTQMQHYPEIQIDLSQIQSSDSAGLALILEWIKFAKLNDHTIKITHIPSYLMIIAKAARVDKLINLNIA